MAAAKKTIHVPHLGGIEVGYRLSPNIARHLKPTLILVNPFTVSAEYYLPDLNNKELTDEFDLLAVEPLGHGDTRTKTEVFTYWDSAIMFLQVLDALSIDKAFVLGTSQGGWMAARMALLAPERIQGIVLVGTSMDYESQRTRDLGCWDGVSAASGFVQLGAGHDPVPKFEPDDVFCNYLIDIGFGKGTEAPLRELWIKTIKGYYQGDEGKRRICMAAVNLSSRDGLHERLPYVKCPVLWLQGTNDVVFSVANALEEIKLFTNSPEAKLVPFEGGEHFLGYTHRSGVTEQIRAFVERWGAQRQAKI